MKPTRQRERREEDKVRRMRGDGQPQAVVSGGKKMREEARPFEGCFSCRRRIWFNSICLRVRLLAACEAAIATRQIGHVGVVLGRRC